VVIIDAPFVLAPLTSNSAVIWSVLRKTWQARLSSGAGQADAEPMAAASIAGSADC